MSQSDAWRYRPLASELRSGRSNLRRRWSLSEGNEQRNALRRDSRDRGADWAGRLFKGYDRWGGKAYGGISALAGHMAFKDYTSDVRRSGSPNDGWADWGARGHRPANGGSYDPGVVPWRPGGAQRWARMPKDQDMPWPDYNAGGGGGGQGTGKAHFNSKVSYTTT